MTQKTFRLIIFIFFFQLFLNNSVSVEPDEILQNQEQELMSIVCEKPNSENCF